MSDEYGAKLTKKEWLDELFGPELEKTAKVLTVAGLLLLTAGTRIRRWLKK
jgi:hypothetical protein